MNRVFYRAPAAILKVVWWRANRSVRSSQFGLFRAVCWHCWQALSFSRRRNVETPRSIAFCPHRRHRRRRPIAGSSCYARTCLEKPVRCSTYQNIRVFLESCSGIASHGRKRRARRSSVRRSVVASSVRHNPRYEQARIATPPPSPPPFPLLSSSRVPR